ncbi:MAG: ABC transporter permease [Promethearchaeota archaeon]
MKKDAKTKKKGKPGERRKLSFPRIMKMVAKEFKLVKTDVPNLMMAIAVAPAVIMFFGYLMSFSVTVQPVNCAIVTYDSNTFFYENTTYYQDNHAPELVNSFNISERVRVVASLNASEDPYSMDTARGMLFSGDISIIVVIPVEFSEFLDLGLPCIIEAVPDSSDLVKIQKNLDALQDGIDVFKELYNLTPYFNEDVVEEFSVPAGYNEGFNSQMSLILPFVMMGISMVLTILVVVQEKPIPRLLLTPVDKNELLLSKYITYSILLLMQCTLVMISSLVMGLYVAGTIFNLFIALFMMGFSGVSLGIFISSLSNTKTEANQLFFAFFIILLLLSGIFIPIENMPVYLQVVAKSLPLAHGAPLITSITTKGLGLFSEEFIVLSIISAVLFVLSFIIFNKKRLQV